MKKTIIISLIFILFPTKSYSDILNDNEKFNKQWETVLQLQRIIDNNIINEAPNLFSIRVRDKIKLMINKNPNFFKSVWGLDHFKLKSYKNNIFKGNGLFILEDNVWKIDEI